MTMPAALPQPVLPAPGEPTCDKMVGESGGLVYPCRLTPGHGSPCYALESDKSKREYGAWALAEIARQNPVGHKHDYHSAGPNLVVCACGDQQQTVTQVLPEPEPDPVAQQFSAATGVQAAMREERLAGGTPAPHPANTEVREGITAAVQMATSGEVPQDPSEFHSPQGVAAIVAEMRKHSRYAESNERVLAERFLALTAVGTLFEQLDAAMLADGHEDWPAQ